MVRMHNVIRTATLRPDAIGRPSGIGLFIAPEVGIVRTYGSGRLTVGRRVYTWQENAQARLYRDALDDSLKRQKAYRRARGQRDVATAGRDGSAVVRTSPERAQQDAVLRQVISDAAGKPFTGPMTPAIRARAKDLAALRQQFHAYVR